MKDTYIFNYCSNTVHVILMPYTSYIHYSLFPHTSTSTDPKLCPSSLW